MPKFLKESMKVTWDFYLPEGVNYPPPPPPKKTFFCRVGRIKNMFWNTISQFFVNIFLW